MRILKEYLSCHQGTANDRLLALPFNASEKDIASVTEDLLISWDARCQQRTHIVRNIKQFRLEGGSQRRLAF